MKIDLDTTLDKKMSLSEEIQEVNKLLSEMSSLRSSGLVVDENMKKNMLNASRNFTSNFSKSFSTPAYQSNMKVINITLDFTTDKN